MNLEEILRLKNLIEILPLISSEEENIFFFKSKNQKIEFLAYGDFNLIDPADISETFFVTGNFEGNHQYFKANNIIIKKNGILTKNILRNPILKDIEINSFDFLIKGFKNCPDQSIWQAMVENSIQQIQNKTIEKIVLKRDRILDIENFNLPLFLNKLLNINEFAEKSYFIFYKTKDHFFLSLTPETLYIVSNDEIHSMALAGSMPRNSDLKKDLENEEFLINDTKLISEHNFVCVDLNQKFSLICDEFNQSSLKILKLPYIQHRLVEYHGKLKPNLSIENLISILHPTPAVGGIESKKAQEIILNLEKKPRHFYAAPFGIKVNNFEEVAVALRCASYHNNQLTIHAGCGITQDSNPSLEWLETENKMSPILKVFSHE